MRSGYARACALLAAVTVLGFGTSTSASADVRPDWANGPRLTTVPATVGTGTGLVTDASATVPASPSLRSASMFGFYWQLTYPQHLLPGDVLLVERADRKESERVSHSDQEFFEISRTGSNDIPEAALRAYRRAAAAMAKSDPGCHLSWTLLAAIGRIESNHGRYGGAQLGSDGVSRPEIIGPQLNGAGPFAAIADSDGGTYDGDAKWDRAVGQMQFLPSTWRSVARDGDGDGRTDPFDIDDSALGAAVYLCGAGDLSDTVGMSRAAFRYNHSNYYVSLVLAYTKGYESGVFALPSPPPPPGDHGRHRKPAPKSEPTKHAKPERDSKPTAVRNKPQPAAPRPSSTPTRSPKPTPSPTQPATPQRVNLSGTWRACAGGYCIDARPVDLGGTSLGGQAAFDLDGDGAMETNGQELDGLVGQKVELVVLATGGSGPVALVEIAGHPWR